MQIWQGPLPGIIPLRLDHYDIIVWPVMASHKQCPVCQAPNIFVLDRKYYAWCSVTGYFLEHECNLGDQLL